MGNSSATLGQAVTDKRATENELRHRGFHLRYAGMAMQGWRRTMEDALAHHHPKFESNGLALFCVFDGHGAFAARAMSARGAGRAMRPLTRGHHRRPAHGAVRGDALWRVPLQGDRGPRRRADQGDSHTRLPGL
jgi:hypothetical protein